MKNTTKAMLAMLLTLVAGVALAQQENRSPLDGKGKGSGQEQQQQQQERAAHVGPRRLHLVPP